MNFYKSVSAVLLALLLSACVGATPYQPEGFSGGYGQQQLDEGMYRVYFRGNGYASSDRVWYFWMYRCAQLTLKHGYKYFSVEKDTGQKPVKSFKKEDEDAVINPANSPYGSPYQSDGFIYAGGHGGGYTTTYYSSPGQTITTWSSKGIVYMYSTNSVASVAYVLDAQSILSNLDAYVKANGKSGAPVSRKSLMAQAHVLPDPALAPAPASPGPTQSTAPLPLNANTPL